MTPPSSASNRLLVITFLFAGFILGTAALNSLIPHIDLPGKAWRYGWSVPTIPPLGADLGIFTAASYKMYTGENPLQDNYNAPPLVAAVFYPSNLVSYEAAYVLQFAQTLLANAAGLILLFLLLRTEMTGGWPANSEDFRNAIAALVLLAACVGQFFGYPLEFSLERGNYDSLAFLAICAALWFSVRRPAACWLHVLLFSFAIHLKVYPAILLLLPLWQHGRRAWLPVIVINVLMLFCFGFTRGIEFLVGLYHYSQHPYMWPGNHSAVSFGSLVLEPGLRGFLSAGAAHRLSTLLLLGPPLALWLLGTLRLVRRRFSGAGALLAAALATPVMCVLPSFSNDYKMVVLVLPVMVCLFHYVTDYWLTGKGRALAGLSGTLLCLLLIARSTLFSPLLFGANHYPVICLLELLCFAAVRQQTEGRDRAGPAELSAALAGTVET